MFFSIITILMAIVPFIMYTQPLFWAYTGEGMDAFNKGYKSTSCYQGINFEVNNGLYIAGCIFMIIALIFAGITILLTFLNLIGKASGNDKRVVGAKLAAFCFFISMLAAVILMGCYMGDLFAIEKFEQIFESTVGYGLLASLLASLFAFIFAPRKRVKEEK